MVHRARHLVKNLSKFAAYKAESGFDLRWGPTHGPPSSSNGVMMSWRAPSQEKTSPSMLTHHWSPRVSHKSLKSVVFFPMHQHALLLKLIGSLATLLFSAGLFLGSELRSPKVLARQLSIKPPDAPEAVEWLQRFYQENAGTSDERPRPAGSLTACRPSNRTNLVLGTVGDGWEPRWLAHPEEANFDLAVLYYGSNPNFSCPGCSEVVRLKGPKWYLVYNLTQSALWASMLARGYEYIMLPDDDLTMETCQISTFFNVAKDFSVLLAQPSVCRSSDSYTCWDELYQLPEYHLHFNNFVEIMAPALRMDFFQAVVRHTLKGTYTGYGLDWVWPALLHWPKDKVAVVDEVCMVHPPSPPGGKPGGLYQVTSAFTQESGKQEQRRTNRRFNLWQPVVWRHGMLWKQPVVFGGVPRGEGGLEEPEGPSLGRQAAAVTAGAGQQRQQAIAGETWRGALGRAWSAGALWVWLCVMGVLAALTLRSQLLAHCQAWLKPEGRSPLRPCSAVRRGSPGSPRGSPVNLKASIPR